MFATAASLAPFPDRAATLFRRPRPHRSRRRPAARPPSHDAGAGQTQCDLPLTAVPPERPLDETMVTPAFLRRISPAVCPITRAPLTRGTASDSDTIVDSAGSGAGFTIGNLAVISAQAARARQGRTVADALRLARRAEVSPDHRADGLGADEWMRLAVLISFATPLPHDEAARLPLRLLPPARLRLLNPVQALQALLALQFTRSGHPRRCAPLADAMPSPETRYAFNALMLTLLARRIAAGRLPDPIAERHAVEDAWRDPTVQRRWERLALALTGADCTRLCGLAAKHQLTGPAGRWLSAEVATDGGADAVAPPRLTP